MVSCPLVVGSVNPDFCYFHSHCCHGQPSNRTSTEVLVCHQASALRVSTDNDKMHSVDFSGLSGWLDVGRRLVSSDLFTHLTYCGQICLLREHLQCIQMLQSIQSRNKLGVFLAPRAPKSLPAANQRVLSSLCRSSSESAKISKQLKRERRQHRADG